MSNKKTGTLYVVATPIGNLDDVTLRAIKVLKSVDRVAAEDTRHAGKLLKHLNINVPSFSLHDFNERERSGELLSYLLAGESVALISDAGTPLISDPGYFLVRLVKEAGVKVVPVPGPCAAIAALSVSGLPSDKFVFEGFLPATSAARLKRLNVLVKESRTMIFYEAARRLIPMLTTVSDVFGAERGVTVARELTKIHESVLTDLVVNVINYYDAHPDQLKGEVVVLVAGAKPSTTGETRVQAEAMLAILMADLPLKQAASLTSKVTGVRKNELYELGLQLKK